MATKKTRHGFLLVHGFQSNKKTTQLDPIEKTLQQQGITTLRIDQYGHGAHPEQFTELTITKAIKSVEEGIQKLIKEGYKPIGIYGSSFGGLTSFFATKSSPEVSLLILKSPVLKEQGKIIAQLKKIDIEEWKKNGTTTFKDKIGTHQLNYQFYEDAQRYEVVDHLQEHKLPTLIVQGTDDHVVPVEQCRELPKKENIELHMITGAAHKFKEEETQQTLTIIKTFINKHWK